jgi:uncharacterized protein YbbC (DUF1343 family)
LRFEPTAFEPKESKFAGQKCQGVSVIIADRNAFEPAIAGTRIVWEARRLFGGSFDFPLVGRLLGSDSALAAIAAANDPAGIPEAWKNEIEAFRAMREKYLLYP